MSVDGLNILDSQAIQKNGVDEIKAIEERVNYYKEELKKMSGKTTLTQEETLIKNQAKGLAETLKSNKDLVETFKETYLRQSRELLSLLDNNLLSEEEVKALSTVSRLDTAQTVDTDKPLPSKLEKAKEIQFFKEEKNVIISYLGLEEKDVDDINLLSLISVISKVSGNSKEDWEAVGYKKDGWIFDDSELSQLNALKNNGDLKEKLSNLADWKNSGIDILSIINSIKLIKENKVEGVLESLCDLNSDGKIDSGDIGLINGKDVIDLINKNSKHETKIFKNISDILGVNFDSKEGLYKVLLAKPSLKYDFFSRLYFLALAGVNLKEALLNGKKGIVSSVENLGQNLLVGEKLTEVLIPGFEKKYDDAVLSLEKKLEDTNLSQEDKNKLIELISIYKGDTNKQKFMESFRMNSAGLLLSFMKENKGFGLGTSISNKKFDEFLKSNTGEIIKGMQVNLGFVKSPGGITPGIGINFSSKEFELSQNVKANFNAGLFLTTPYLTGTLRYNYNTEDIARAGFNDFTENSKNIGLTLNTSTLASGLTLHWSKDKIEAIEKKEKQFKELLDELFSQNFDSINTTSILNSNQNLSEDDKKYIQKFITKINDTLNLVGYSKLNDEHKLLAISGVKYALLNEWKTGVYTQAQKDGIEFSGFGIGLQFVAGLLPIITAGVRFTDHKSGFVKDRQAEVLQAMSSDKLGKSGENTKLNGDEIVKGLKEFKNEDLDIYLTQNQDRIVGLAQRNSKDYPLFLRQLSSGDYTNAILSLEKILKKDSVIKNDKYIKSLLLSINSFNDMQKAYILSQFMDAIFKDKNTISQVLTSNNLWKDRERGLKNVYTDKEIYPQVVSLRDKIRLNVGKNPTPVLEKGIMGFVASYKIMWTQEGKQKSLGRGEAAIPPGLATVVGGQDGIEKINDEKLINHTIEDLKKTPFYDKLSSSLEKIIASKYPDFKFDNNTFENFLKTGVLSVGGKVVKLDRDFVFFLYGKCANETFGLKINGIDLGDGEIQKLEFDPSGEIIPNMPVLEATDYTIGVLGGGERKPVDQPPPEDTTTTPENTPPENTPPENTPPENTPPENTPPENTPPENTPPENTPPENTSPENTSPENTSPENTSPVVTTTPENTFENTAPPSQGDQ